MDGSESPTGFWAVPIGDLFELFGSSHKGLESDDVEGRRLPPEERLGARRHSDLTLLARQFENPLILLLLAAAAVSLAMAERVDSFIILVIVIGSGLLGFVQERGAVRAIEALRSLVTVHVDVLRDEHLVEMAIDDVVPGDVIHLDTGDVVPGDCIVLEANRLSVDESVLTGEAFPVMKEPGVLPRPTAMAQRRNSLYLGSHVVSGSGTALVVSVGRHTEFGSIEEHIAQRHLPTAFERGVMAYGLLLVKATAVLVLGVFVLNIVLDRSLSESVLFSLALAVGLAPQMLPAIVTLSLSIGARMLAAEKVIVKRLDAIEDFGSVDVLCTDKTGTLTEGTVHLEGAFDVRGTWSSVVLERAFWNAHLQVGHSNPIDAAIIESVGHEIALPIRVAEIPFDFMRKLVSVIVEEDSHLTLVCKGAFEQVLSRCGYAVVDGRREPIVDHMDLLQQTFVEMSSRGLRLLGVAERDVPEREMIDGLLEVDLAFIGFVAFVDPPKQGSREAIQTLRDFGVAVKIITGDNRAVSRMTASTIGLDNETLLTGGEIDRLSDAELARLVEETSLFVEVDPLQKERIIRALSSRGHTVGFVGDGVNDVAALHAADVGISVDSGVDVAKKTADLILLDKSLSVIGDGIQQGRRVFVNTLKYVYVTTSANFGNMVSLACATAFLPFLPMLPLQILLLNFLSDIPGMTIATDNIDRERLSRPQQWNISQVRRFMIVFGLLSTSVDLATFALLRLAYGTEATELRTGWFLVSLLTEIVAMLLLRTARHVHRSRPSRALGLTSFVVVLTAFVLVLSSMGEPFRLSVLPLGMTATLIALVGVYALITEVLKVEFASLFR